MMEKKKVINLGFLVANRGQQFHILALDIIRFPPGRNGYTVKKVIIVKQKKKSNCTRKLGHSATNTNIKNYCKLSIGHTRMKPG